MNDRITANLPARDFSETERFYTALGFQTTFRDDEWMIVARGSLEIEFFVHRDLVASKSWFSATVRVTDVDALHRAWSAAGLPLQGIPRLTAPCDEPWGLRQANLVDCNGSLLRIVGPINGQG